MEKKYKLTDEILEVGGHVLHRIKALRDFGNVKKGDIGGWIECEDNLSHDDDCWVYDNAKIYADAGVYGEARVYDNAKIYADAEVYGEARVYGKAEVCGLAEVCEKAEVYGEARVYGKAEVCEKAEVYGEARVYGKAEVYGEARVYGKAEVCGLAEVCEKAEVCGEAVIKSKSDYIVFKNWWSSGRYFTWTRSNDMWSVGCFYGTGEELITKAYNDSEESGREYERIVKYVESIKRELK